MTEKPKPILALMLIAEDDGNIRSGYCIKDWHISRMLSRATNLVVWLKKPPEELKQLAEEKTKSFIHSTIINAYEP